MKNDLKIGIVILVIFSTIFGVTIFQEIKKVQAVEPRVLTIRQGGTATNTFGANSIIVSGSTGTGALSASASPQVGFINATTTATSTFIGGIVLDSFQTSSTTATSTMAAGLKLSSGCFEDSTGSCVGGGGGLTIGDAITGGAVNRILFEDGSNLLGESSTFIFDGTNFGIGTTTPGTPLSVTGDAVITGTTTVAGLVATSSLEMRGNIFFDADSVYRIGNITNLPASIHSDSFNLSLADVRLYTSGTTIIFDVSRSGATQRNFAIKNLDGSGDPHLQIFGGGDSGSLDLYMDDSNSHIDSTNGDIIFNTDIRSDTDSTDDLGSSSIFFDLGFIDELVLSNDGTGATAANTVRLGGSDLSAGDAGLLITTEDDTDYLFASRAGFASTTPWGQLSVEAVKGVVGVDNPIFVVGDQGTSTPLLIVNANGDVGIGTTTPGNSKVFGIAGDFYVGGSATSTIENNLHVLGTLQTGSSSFLNSNSLTFSDGGSISSVGGNISFNTATNDNLIITAEGTGDLLLTADSDTNVGIGITDPTRALHVRGEVHIEEKLDIGIPGAAGGLDVGEGGSYTTNATGTTIVQVFTYDASASSGSRFTEAETTDTTTWLGDAGDRFYIGSTKKFWAVRFNTTQAKSSEVLQVHYYNGTVGSTTDHMGILKDAATSTGQAILEQTNEKEYVTWDRGINADWVLADDETDLIPDGDALMYWIYFQVPIGDLATVPIVDEVKVRGDDVDFISGTPFIILWGQARIENHDRISLSIVKSPGGTGTANVAISQTHSQTVFDFNGVDELSFLWTLPEGIDTSSRIEAKLDYAADANDTFDIELTASKLTNATAIGSGVVASFNASSTITALVADTIYTDVSLMETVLMSIQDLMPGDLISFELARTDTSNSFYPFSITIHYVSFALGEHVKI